LITNRLSNDVGNSAGNFAIFTLSSKNYLQFYNFVFEQAGASNIFSLVDSTDLQWHKCLFMQVSSQNGINVSDTTTNGLTKNYVLRQCIFSFYGTAGPYSDASVGKSSATQNYVYSLTFDRCFFDGASSSVVTLSNATSATYSGTGFYFYNCTGLSFSLTNIRDDVQVKNCIGGPNRTWSTTGSLTAGGIGATISNCACYATSGLSGYTVTNLRTSKYLPYNTGIQRLWGLPQVDWFTADGLYTYATGDTSGTPAVDFYDVAWAGGAPNVGSYNNYTTTVPGQYNPPERNASTITIAPGSTSQSIGLYLGATGLTASTSGLSAYYNRTRTASVSIPLVARTIAQAWTAGGFAEVDSTNMPGVYRLDLPDAALAAGADDVTVVVRGASGTNGAVMTVKLSSGGLTEAQTASAVWGASPAGYNDGTTFGGVVNTIATVANDIDTQIQDVPGNVWEELTVNHDTHGTYGWNILRADQQSKEGLVTLHQSGGVSRVDADIHAIVNDTDAAVELKGALLHNGTDYISANLLTPTSPATLLRMGPYSVVADQAKQEINIDILTGSSLPVVLQLVDVTGTGIPLVGATLSVKIYNAAGTLVTTYTGTASYSDAGFLTFTLDSVVTATPGTYYITVTRTTGATDTSIYGGLRLYVRSN